MRFSMKIVKKKKMKKSIVWFCLVLSLSLIAAPYCHFGVRRDKGGKLTTVKNKGKNSSGFPMKKWQSQYTEFRVLNILVEL